MHRVLLALALFALAFPAAAACPVLFQSDVPLTTCVAADGRFDAVRNELIDAVRNRKIPSVSIAVIDGGKTIWEESIGWSDIEKKIPANADTGYLLASLGKSVTATAVMKLVERGRVDLGAPISRYLGDAKLTVYGGSGEAVTVTRVLDMTAEIPHGGLSFSSAAARSEYTTASLVRNRGIVVFPAGTIAMYSNMNYGVAEQMIATASGELYPAFMRDELFAPLGMQHSWVGPNRSGGAQRYSGDGAVLPASFSIPESSLSMYASIDDLARYARLHLGLLEKPYLRPATLLEMHNHKSGVDHAPLALGIGHIDLDGGETFLLTNGRAGGGQSTLGMLPQRRTAVMCLINATGGRTDDIVFRVTDILHPGFVEQMHSRIAAYQAWADQPFTPTADVLGSWRGTIVNNATSLPIELLFQPDGDVHVRIADQLETLVKLGYHDGLLSGRFLADVPAEEKAGHPHQVTISLLRSGSRLSGFLTSDFANERGSFSLASYVSLEKVASH